MKQDGYFRFRLPQDLLDKAKKEADKRELNLSEIIRIFLIELTKEGSK